MKSKKKTEEMKAEAVKSDKIVVHETLEALKTLQVMMLEHLDRTHKKRIAVEKSELNVVRDCTVSEHWTSGCDRGRICSLEIDEERIGAALSAIGNLSQVLGRCYVYGLFDEEK